MDCTSVKCESDCDTQDGLYGINSTDTSADQEMSSYDEQMEQVRNRNSSLCASQPDNSYHAPESAPPGVNSGNMIALQWANEQTLHIVDSSIQRQTGSSGRPYPAGTNRMVNSPSDVKSTGQVCAAVGCSLNQQDNPLLSFFSFPKDENR